MSDANIEEANARRAALRLVAGQEPQPARRGPRAVEAPVSFDRRELRVIFDLYGAKVAAGEWRDYALDFSSEKAVFSIFRRASEAPLYRIEKNPALARRQGAYSVVATGGLVMRRGQDLERVIRVLDKVKLVALD